MNPPLEAIESIFNSYAIEAHSSSSAGAAIEYKEGPSQTDTSRSKKSGSTGAPSSSSFSRITDMELTPFIWSAGLVAHPDFASRTKSYLKLKKMEHNVHLWPLQFLSKSMAESLMSS
jgi:hypothetical protein